MTETDIARILLVDDMEDNLIALEAVLAPLNQPLVRAYSGAEAMKALLREDFAVVLLDVVMPDMDGFETAFHIKRLDQTADIPIIFLTGATTGTEHVFRGYSTGAVDYMTKPFDPWVLRAKVAVFLDLHRKTRRLQQLHACDLDRLDAFSDRLAKVEGQLAASHAPNAKRLCRDIALLEEALREMQGVINQRTSVKAGSDTPFASTPTPTRKEPSRKRTHAQGHVGQTTHQELSP
ncbi:two-component system response regulator [Streptomyces sp. NPDC058572]|uniref:response regulator n=1 Tax=Streptomyces sp. NPDC058572 TaxID=3346546 RepID=UPI003667974C